MSLTTLKCQIYMLVDMFSIKFLIVFFLSSQMKYLKYLFLLEKEKNFV